MLIYNSVTFFYHLLIRLASVRNEKAKQWVSGRKNWRNTLSTKINTLNSKQNIWMHCASYGEFEQGRPLLEAIRKKYPGYKIILSFFSPSGYSAFKDWQGADVVCCLPADSKRNAGDFLEIVKPVTAIFIKYEFWLHYLFQLKKNKTPTFLVSAVFKVHHPFFKWYGSIFKRSLASFNVLFVQDELSGKLLETIHIKNYQVSGDTRFDRVLEIKQQFTPLPLFDDFSKGKKILIGGSTWAKDEELLVEVFKSMNRSDLKMILVPHQVDSKSISELEKRLTENKIVYTLYSKPQFNEATAVLVVDTMGLLSRLYHYASISYIGGGFNSGIHNCLEPAVYFKPIVFYGGDDYHKYNEALELLELHSAKNITNASELQLAIQNYLDDKDFLKTIEQNLALYFEKNSGSTEKVLKQLDKVISSGS